MSNVKRLLKNYFSNPGSSFPRRRESIIFKRLFWMPVTRSMLRTSFTGMTTSALKEFFNSLSNDDHSVALHFFRQFSSVDYWKKKSLTLFVH